MFRRVPECSRRATQETACDTMERRAGPVCKTNPLGRVLSTGGMAACSGEENRAIAHAGVQNEPL